MGDKNISYIKLGFIKANICLMTTPGINVFQLKKSPNVSFYTHVIHSMGSLLLYRLYSFDYFDAVICSSDLQSSELKEIEKLRNIQQKEYIIAGSSYLDYLADKTNTNLKITRNNDKLKILIAPSWGPNSLLNKYGIRLIDILYFNKNIEITIRPHPQSLLSEKLLIDKLMEQTKNKNITWDFESFNYQSLYNADLLISDFSSIIIDYLCLYNKPFIYSLSNFNLEIYDASDIDIEPFNFKILRELGFELTEDNLNNINNIINTLKNNDNSYKRNCYKNLLWQNQGFASEKIVDYLFKKNIEIQNKKIKKA